MAPPFQRLLIANRAEIAVRITKTCRRMGIHSIAVYSDADAGAMHVREADSAEYIGASPASESYLNVESILEAAERSGAEAIHPGYGFLSENPDFAEACAEAGLVFVGPSPEAIRAMGDKVNARRLMATAGVPVIPGYDGADGRPEAIAKAVEEIGYPLMVKAAAGGGGRGMRVVREALEMNDALEGASREAEAAFGDGRIFIEKLIEGGRHIEGQIFGDSAGHVVFLSERECSIQRRHQKVVEESPSPAVNEALRTRLGEAAVKAGEAVQYTNAGTVEFLLAPDESFYFLEMNTRLQVEHPATEETLGVDLVEWQLRVAAGECLPPIPESTGHSIEFRLYAEDPGNGFAPAPGLLERLEVPAGTRWDGGYEVGDDVPVHYDPLLGKLVVKGPDRASAIELGKRALGRTLVRGPATNLPLLRWLAADAEFLDGDFDVAWLENRLGEPATRLAPPVEVFLCLAAWDLHGAGSSVGAWRPVGTRGLLSYAVDGEVRDFWYEPQRYGEWMVTEASTSWRLSDLEVAGSNLSIRLEGRRSTAVVFEAAEGVTIDFEGNLYAVERGRLERGGARSATAREGHLVKAPMPGVVLRVLTAKGVSVRSGETVAILEAMKMEHQLKAPTDGIIADIYVSEGDRVDEGALILSLGAPGLGVKSESEMPG